MTRLLTLALLTATLISSCTSPTDPDAETLATIQTSLGDIRVTLFNTTPRHRGNFIKLANDDYYKGLLFHRVIANFMVQAGDPDSRDAAPGVPLGNGGPGYTIPAEIGAAHFRGALAGARQPDGVNPRKESSGSQFYIVTGYVPSETRLGQVEQMKGFTYSPAQRELYLSRGGRPDLDGEYTVFGEVVAGMDVVDAIANAAKGAGDRPTEDIEIIDVVIE